jgi:glycosyltransferase involved in cell wall biosynthesis
VTEASARARGKPADAISQPPPVIASNSIQPTEMTETLPDRTDLPDDEKRLQEQLRTRYAGEVQGVVARRTVRDPKATLVVVSYRAKEYLLECLRHLQGQTLRGELPYEILLADSGGLEPLRDRYGTSVDVELRLRPGLPLNVARNAAMAWARAPLVAYIDDDGLVAPDWLERALAVFEDPSVVVARGRIVPKDHPYFNAFVVHYDRGDAIWDDDSLGTEGNMMVRRMPYLAVGGFPDDFYGAEGLYLVYALKKAFPSGRAVYAPDVVMRHDYCRSMREFVWKARKYRTVGADVTRDDPEFAEFRRAFMRAPKPAQRRTPAEIAARRFLRGAEWLVQRVSLFDHVTRRRG